MAREVVAHGENDSRVRRRPDRAPEHRDGETGDAPDRTPASVVTISTGRVGRRGRVRRAAGRDGLIQRTAIHLDGKVFPGSHNEDAGAFKMAFALNTMSKDDAAQLEYAGRILSELGTIPQQTAFDIEMCQWLEGVRGELEGKIRQTALARFEALQVQHEEMVVTAATTAVDLIRQVVGRAGTFAENLRTIAGYIERKAKEYDQGHFLCSPDRQGDQDELAHSKANGAIELFGGWFEATAQRRAELLIHEAAHSCLKVPDFAYEWEPIFAFLPEPTRLVNPDSYVALVRNLLGGEHTAREVVGGGGEGDEDAAKAVAMVRHACLRARAPLEIALKALPADTTNSPEATIGTKGQLKTPQLAILKRLRPKYGPGELRYVALQALMACARISGARFDVIRPNDRPLPTKLAQMQGAAADGVVRVDLAGGVNRYPLVLAKVLLLLGTKDDVVVPVSLVIFGMANEFGMKTADLQPGDSSM